MIFGSRPRPGPSPTAAAAEVFTRSAKSVITLGAFPMRNSSHGPYNSNSRLKVIYHGAGAGRVQRNSKETLEKSCRGPRTRNGRQPATTGGREKRITHSIHNEVSASILTKITFFFRVEGISCANTSSLSFAVECQAAWDYLVLDPQWSELEVAQSEIIPSDGKALPFLKIR